MTARTYNIIDNWDGSAVGAFTDSWQAIAGNIDVRQKGVAVGRPSGQFNLYAVRGGQTVRLSRKWVTMDVDIRFDHNFQAFMRRLDLLASPQEKRLFTNALRKVTRTIILPVLRQEIPKGKRTRLRPRRLAATAQIMKIWDDRIVISVGRNTTWRGPKGGRYGLWHASIVHSRWHPFFPHTFRRTWRPFNEALSKELHDLLQYLAGKRPAKFGRLRSWR